MRGGAGRKPFAGGVDAVAAQRGGGRTSGRAGLPRPEPGIQRGAAWAEYHDDPFLRRVAHS